jgi:hypothetical protein
VTRLRFIALVLTVVMAVGMSAAPALACEPPPGCGTPGYWKNHPEAWPVCEIEIGGQTYTKAEAIGFMQQEGGDKSFTLFRALVAAKLNQMIGNPTWCPDCSVNWTMCLADYWLEDNPVGSGVKGNSCEWKEGECLYLQLDDYNNGLMCAPARD